jgi:6-phosphogluconolactonase
MNGGGGGPALTIVEDAAALARRGAELVVEAAREAIAERGTFSLALSGGSTPRALYTLLAEPPFAGQVAWAQVEVWWGDERCVSPDDPQSNYRMAREALLSKVPIPAENVHRMRGEDPDPAAAAAAYEAELHAAFALEAGALPRLDLVLLGMGPDGHTASLFPDTTAVRIADRLVAVPFVPHLNAYRLTLTLAVLNAARRVLFLVAGADKAATLRAVLEAGRPAGSPLGIPRWGAADDEARGHHTRGGTTNVRGKGRGGEAGDPALPASLIHPHDGTLLWLVDRAAAGSAPGLPPS